MSMLASPPADPPELVIKRDDHVATIEMDYDETAGIGGQLWTVGTDGTDPVGFRVQWWPDAADTSSLIKGGGCFSDQHTGTPTFATEENPHQMITPHRIIQVQPIANNVTYHLRVTKLNSLGEECSPPTLTTFEGGDGTRVQSLAAELTFFDDFNLPEGQNDEMKWNSAYTPQTDPRHNMFFINKQCHTHTLNGTLNGARGDKSQVAQRARKPILIEENVRRKIVFDMDGIFSPRGVWYLDLNPVKTDLTGHMSFFDSDGDTGLPADVLRIRAKNNDLSVNLINSAGESYNVGEVELNEVGRGMCTNVRRSFELSVAADGIEVFVDGTSVLDITFNPGDFKPGVYHLLWSTIGYNTSKDDNPYFLSHWDNFGFDGPDQEPFVVHNYVTQLIGSDLQKANWDGGEIPEFVVNVPDDVRPVAAGLTNEIFLVFTYMKNDWSTFNIQEGDYVEVNGVSYDLPPGANNSQPTVPDLVNYAGSTISNRVKLGDVVMGGSNPLVVGENTIQFFATNTGIVNLHIEVLCPEGYTSPPYTSPEKIHPYKKHHDLDKTGLPAKLISIGDSETENPTLSGEVAVEILVGNTSWSSSRPYWLNVPSVSAEQWSTGNTRGIEKVELFLRSIENDSTYGYMVSSLNTSADAPAPQLRYEIGVDTRKVVNGEYDLFLLATDSKGLRSHPGYDGFGFEWDVSELSGAFWGARVTVSNPVVEDFIFTGTSGEEWTENGSWSAGLMPPYGYEGRITVEADCTVPREYLLEFEKNAEVVVKSGSTLAVQH